MAALLLLLEDVEDLGRSGDVVKVKPGFARNFLLPRGFGIIADKNALRLQERLQEERKLKAEQDRKQSEAQSKTLANVTLTATVKIDQDGHMYGSVSSMDIVNLLKEQQKFDVEKRQILLKNPIKVTGIHTIEIKLKEGVTGSFTLKVMPEEVNGTEPQKEDVGTE